MNSGQPSSRRRSRRTRTLAAISLFAVLARLLVAVSIVGIVTFGDERPAAAHSVGQIDMSVNMSPATQQLLVDRAVAGTPGYQVGDVIEAIVRFTPVPNGANVGPNGWVTMFVPDNMTVVGAAFVRPDGNGDFLEVAPDVPAPIEDGWGRQGAQTFGDLTLPPGTPDNPGATPITVPFSGATQGSLAQLYADTGIFFSMDPRTAKYVEVTAGDGNDPSTVPSRLTNGYRVDPTGCDQLLSIVGASECRTHNLWDANMTNAFGTSAAPPGTPPEGYVDEIASGRGNTPHLTGSPVAGPDTHYGQDYTGAVGPWQRIAYPGSMTGTGTAAVAAGAPTDTAWVPTSAGRVLDEANPLPAATNAVRWAVGAIEVGEIEHAMLRLRIDSDPNGCALIDSEVFGGDAAGVDNGQDNPWRYHEPVPSPGYTCMLLQKDGPAVANEDVTSQITYTITMTNGSVADMTNVAIGDILPEDVAFVSASDGGTESDGVVTWPTVPVLAAGATVSRTVTVDISGSGTSGYLQNTATVSTDQTLSAQTVWITQLSPLVDMFQTKTVSPGTTNPDTEVTYTITLDNRGSEAATAVTLVDTLPTGFSYVPGSTVVDGAGAADPAVTGQDLTWSLGTMAALVTRTVEFGAHVDAAIPRETTYTNAFTTTWSETLYPTRDLTTPATAPVFVASLRSSIGDLVWDDADGNGVADPGELGLDGVTVELYEDTDGDGTYETFVGSQPTAGGGGYVFADLLTGDYRVQIDAATLPPGYVTTTPVLVDVSLPEDTVFVDADFGAGPFPSSVGDLVFGDADGDGVFEPGAGESGIGGITVDLYADTDGDGTHETLVATVVTDGAGAYDFDNLGVGDYRVDVDETSAPVAALAQSTPDTVDVSLGISTDFDLADFGFTPAATIGDRVWDDLDADGIQDPGEGGVAGVTVTLLQDTDDDGSYETLVATQATDGSGGYDFTDLPPGEYRVDVDLSTAPPGYAATTPLSVEVSLPVGADFDAADVGVRFQPVSIGDLVWDDLDGDGVTDPGEPGLDGVTVELYEDTDGDGTHETLVGSQVTAGGGAYSFEFLTAGDYRVDVVEATLPAGYVPTTPEPFDVTVGDIEDVDYADFGYRLAATSPEITKTSDAPPLVPPGTVVTYDAVVTNTSGTLTTGVDVDDPVPPGLTPVAGSTVLTVDQTLLDTFELRRYDNNVGSVLFPSDWVEIGESNGPTTDRVSVRNGGGRWPTGYLRFRTEPAVVGLERAAGDLSDWVGATLSFLYLRENVGDIAGTDDRQLYVEVAPDGVGFVRVACINSEGLFTSGVCDPTTSVVDDLAPLAATLDITAHLGPATAVRFVTNAVDQGDLELDDIRISGVRVLTGGDPPDLSTGLALLDGETLRVTYQATVDDPNPFSAITNAVSFTTDQQPSPTAADHTITLARGSIGDLVFDDANSSGTRDAGEGGLADVRVELWRDTDGDGSHETLVGSQSTDALGAYLFDGLPAGVYEVRLHPATLPPSYVPTTPVAVAAPLPAGQDRLDADFGAAGQTDFGDAPASYGTTRADDGPRHAITGPHLGTLPDADSDGMPAAPSTPAIGDDTTGAADEDGVALPPLIDGGVTTTITVDVGGPSTGASYLNGWFDFDNSGTFDPGESIFAAGVYVSSTPGLSPTGRVAGPGTHEVTINVPDFASNGSGYIIGDIVYSRFRIATAAADVASPVGPAETGEVEDHSQGINTLPIELRYFEVSLQGRELLFEWATSVEIDNLGFNLLVEGERGAVEPLNEQLIVSAAPNSITSNGYRWRAPRPARSLSRSYWLEDVSLEGVVTRHGPFRIGEPHGRPPVTAVAAPSTVHQQQGPIHVSRQDVDALASAGEPIARVHVTETGIQRVTVAALREAGVDLVGRDSADLALVRDGAPVPILWRGGPEVRERASFEFVGRAVDTLYSGTAEYLLYLDPSRAARIERQRRRAPVSKEPVRMAPATVVVDRDRQYSVSAPGNDPWFDRNLIATSAGASATYPVELVDPGPGSADAVLTVTLWGVTNFPVEDEHHVRLALNGVVLADEVFDGAVEHVIAAPVPDSVALDETNELQITVVGDTNVPVDVVAIDSFALDYGRELRLGPEQLRFRAIGDQVTVSGVTRRSARVLRVDDDGTVTVVRHRIERSSQSPPEAQFPATGNAEYLVAGLDAMLSPAVSAAEPRRPLPAGPIDYLILSHPAFVEHLDPLVDHHQARGLRVGIADVETVYDLYGRGEPDAAAIDAYLAAEAPSLGLDYVLLAGADTYDYRDYDGDGVRSFVPTPYAPTGRGVRFAPVDPAYADLDDDGVPDLALGRLPARSVSELRDLIDASVRYSESAPTRERSVVLASDVSDNIRYSRVNDTLQDLLGGWQVTRADLDTLEVDVARRRVLDGVGGVSAVTSFVGHSGPTDWTEVGLLGVDDLGDQRGDGLPSVVTQFGCWNTYYVGVGGLGEALLTGTGGAAAVLGASTLTSASTDIAYAELLMAELGGAGTLGEAVQAAKLRLASRVSGAADIHYGWTLLGDPALALPRSP